MKCIILGFYLILVVFWNINTLNPSQNTLENSNNDGIKNLLDCKMCQEMFEYDFNYEKMLKDESKISFIRSQFEEFGQVKFNFKDYFSSENLEFVSKEISMQYFFKGEETQFSNDSNDENINKFKKCKNIKVGKDNICDELKFKFCESILGYEKGTCLKKKEDINKKMLLKKSINEKDKKNILIDKAINDSFLSEINGENNNFNSSSSKTNFLFYLIINIY